MARSVQSSVSAQFFMSRCDILYYGYPMSIHPSIHPSGFLFSQVHSVIFRQSPSIRDLKSRMLDNGPSGSPSGPSTLNTCEPMSRYHLISALLRDGSRDLEVFSEDTKAFHAVLAISMVCKPRTGVRNDRTKYRRR